MRIEALYNLKLKAIGRYGTSYTYMVKKYVSL